MTILDWSGGLQNGYNQAVIDQLGITLTSSMFTAEWVAVTDLDVYKKPIRVACNRYLWVLLHRIIIGYNTLPSTVMIGVYADTDSFLLYCTTLTLFDADMEYCVFELYGHRIIFVFLKISKILNTYFGHDIKQQIPG